MQSGPLAASGLRLRDARRYVRLSQTALAEFIGTTRQSIAAFEKGARAPTLDHLVKAANILRVTPDDLLSARSLSSARTPSFHPRADRAGRHKQLPESDSEELARFERYLHERRANQGALVFTRDKTRAVGDEIARLYQRTKVTSGVPVGIFGLLAKSGIEVRFTALESLAGALLVSPDVAVRPHGVLINSDQPQDRQRFSAAHELGHLVMGHEPQDGEFIDILGRNFDPMEVQADTFASELLMPAMLVKQRYMEHSAERATHRVLRLARAFLVSYQAMTVRLSKLALLTPTEVGTVKKAKPRDVAAEVGPPARRKGVAFTDKDVVRSADRYLPRGWESQATPEWVRLLQETAYAAYLAEVPDDTEADATTSVYETVARWVARKHPLIA